MKPTGTAVLCVHGIQENPGIFNWILSALPAHIAAENLLLPGHGEDVRSFRRSGMREWQTCVDAKILELSRRYENIIYIGHSMGCLLGIDACIRLSSKVSSLILLACPLSLRPTWRYFWHSFCGVASIRLDNPYVAAARMSNGVQARSPLAYLTCLRPYRHLLLKIRAVRKQLPELKLPVHAIHSRNDEIVSIRSLECFKLLPQAKTTIAPGSGHHLYSPAARQEILAVIRDALIL